MWLILFYFEWIVNFENKSIKVIVRVKIKILFISKEKKMTKDYYKKAFEITQQENEKLRQEIVEKNKILDFMNGISGSKDMLIKDICQENEELKGTVETLREKGGSIVGTSTQALNKSQNTKKEIDNEKKNIV